MNRRFSGPRLKSLRQAAGLSLERVAIDVDRSCFSVIAYERGAGTPPGAVLGRLADSIGCSVDDFYVDLDEAGAA